MLGICVTEIFILCVYFWLATKANMTDLMKCNSSLISYNNIITSVIHLLNRYFDVYMDTHLHSASSMHAVTFGHTVTRQLRAGAVDRTVDAAQRSALLQTGRATGVSVGQANDQRSDDGKHPQEVHLFAGEINSGIGFFCSGTHKVAQHTVGLFLP